MTKLSANNARQQLERAFAEKHGATIKGWDDLAEKFHYHELSSQEHWIKAGDYCVELCVILEGLFRVYYIDRAGNEVNQHFYQANEVFAPISAIISNEPCQYYIQALEPVKLMSANYDALHKVASDNPDWLRLEIRMLQTVFLKNAKHEAQLLLGNGEQRFKWFRKEYPELLERVPQYHIASFLGITPVSLSRLRKKIEAADPSTTP